MSVRGLTLLNGITLQPLNDAFDEGKRNATLDKVATYAMPIVAILGAVGGGMAAHHYSYSTGWTVGGAVAGALVGGALGASPRLFMTKSYYPVDPEHEGYPEILP